MSSNVPRWWLGYVPVGVLLLVSRGDPNNEHAPLAKAAALVVLYLGGLAYYLFCVYRMHSVLNVADAAYPVTPAQAVGYHFIPFFCAYWVFKWPNTIADFVNRRLEGKRMRKGWAGFFLLVVGGIFTHSPGGYWMGLVVWFTVGVYLARKVSIALATIPSPDTG